MGYRLDDDSYVEIPQQPDGGLFSETLNLTIHLLDDTFGLYDPGTEQWLQSAEERAEQEAEARQKAEKKVQKLQEELKRLRTRLE